MNQKFIIMLGPPGSGKGTQGKQLAKVINFDYFSMGQVLREVSKGDSETAQLIRKTIDAGHIIPDEMIKRIFLEQLDLHATAKGIVIDAFPRDIAQVNILNDAVKDRNVEDVKVVFLDVPLERLKSRIAERNEENTVKRADDRPSIIHTRFEEYEAKTFPLKDYFEKQGILIVIDGDHPIEEVHQTILNKVGVKE